MNANICHLTTVHPLLDDRILYKECRSLASEGYQVSLVAQNPDGISIPGIRVLPLPSFSSRMDRFFRGNWLAFRLAKRSGATLVHFHDPELLFTGLALRLAGRKIVYDVHENIAQQVLYKTWVRPALLRRVLALLVRLLERGCVLSFRAVVAATGDIASCFPGRKTIVIRNLPILEWTKDIPVTASQPGRVILFYAGGLTRIRGIREVLLAMEALGDTVSLRLAGTFDDPGYERECRGLKAWERVDYHGYVPLQEVYRLAASADIGLALLHPAENYLKSLPVKAFEYMAFGKPMVMSDFPFWQDMFAGCALFCDPKNPEQIASRIRILMNDAGTAKKMGEAGRRKIMESLSWEAERLKLSELYQRLCHESQDY